MKNAVFWDIKSQFVPHKIHYFSATEPSPLKLCKIWGLHGGDYEECRLLGYKIPVRTSQDILLFRYRAQPVNVMQDLRFTRRWLWRMSSSGLWRRVVLVRTVLLRIVTATVTLSSRIQSSWCRQHVPPQDRFYAKATLRHIGRTPWVGDQSHTKPLLAHRTTQTYPYTCPGFE
jgi:hypothetical protein